MDHEMKKAYDLVRQRSHGVCEVGVPGVCRGGHETTHHRRKRRHGDTRAAASNLLGVCGSGTTGCHGWIESHPERSAEYGWHVYSKNSPTDTPVYLLWYGQRGWWLLDDEGVLHPVLQDDEPDTAGFGNPGAGVL